MPALIVLKQPCCLAPTQMVAAEAEPMVTAENAAHSTPRKTRSQAPMCPIPPPIQLRIEGNCIRRSEITLARLDCSMAERHTYTAGQVGCYLSPHVSHAGEGASVVDLKFPSFRWRVRLGTSNPKPHWLSLSCECAFESGIRPKPG